jgi:hypothetical protein
VLTSLLHKLAAHLWVCDRIQVLAGLDRILERLSPKIEARRPRVVVDVGGGTGNVRNLLDVNFRYVRLDLVSVQRLRKV